MSDGQIVDAARRGVHVCVLYDWLGGVWTSRLFWRQLTEHGVDVRCFNRPRVANVFGLSSRDLGRLQDAAIDVRMRAEVVEVARSPEGVARVGRAPALGMIGVGKG